MLCNLLTVDVEDNFTYEELTNKKDWQKYEDQVVENTLRILSLLKKYNVSATFFVVGMVAERHPELVGYIIKSGCEIASHSYWHKPLRQMVMDEVEKDAKSSMEILSSLAGRPILGYRAMGFSIPEDEIKFLQLLKKYGYTYDSSNKYNKYNTCQTILNNDILQIYPSSLNLFDTKIYFAKPV